MKRKKNKGQQEEREINALHRSSMWDVPSPNIRVSEDRNQSRIAIRERPNIVDLATGFVRTGTDDKRTVPKNATPFIKKSSSDAFCTAKDGQANRPCQTSVYKKHVM